MAEVFLSYARPNAAKAKRVAAALTAAGHDVWLDDQLPTHRSFYEVIEERLRSAKAVVVLWSKAAAQSQWVRAEADMARNLGKLVQAALDDDLPPIPFNQIQCAHLKSWTGNPDHVEWKKVLDGVRAVGGAGRRHSAPAQKGAGRRPNRVWLPFAGLAVGAMAILALAFVLLRPPSSDAPRLAVLPFEVIGTDPGAREFAAALASELSGSLSENQLQALPVSRGLDIAGPEHAAALKRIGVDLALGGTVRNVGGRLSVRAYVEDVASGVSVWSAQFEQPMDRPERLLAEVSAAVTETAFTVSEALVQPGVRLDPQTLSLFLKGSEQLKSPSLEDPGTARFDDLVRRAPKFAAGHAALALTLASIAPAKSERAAVRRRARQEATLAIALYAPASGAAYDALFSLAREEAPTDFGVAEKVLRDGLAHAPEFPFLHMRLCSLLMEVGRATDALPSCNQAVALRPLAPPPAHFRARALYYAGQRDAAVRSIDEAFSRAPNHISTRRVRFEMQAFGGQKAQAGQAAKILVDPSQKPQSLTQVATDVFKKFLSARQSGAQADADAALGAAEAGQRAGQIVPRYVVMMASSLGRLDEAFRMLSAFRAPNVLPAELLFDPALESLRRDPRFMRIASDAGLIAYWRKSGHWPDFCGEPDWPYDCRAEALEVSAAQRE